MALDYSFDEDFPSSGLDSDAVWAGIQGMGEEDDDGWSSILKNLGGNSSGLLSLLSSAYGLVGSNQITQMAKGAFGQANPFGPYRPQYGAELQQLMANPGSITSKPGYQFQFDQGAQAVSRRMGASGFHGSSNEAIALTKYGQDYASNFYDKELQRLMVLSGATITPAGAGTGIQGASMGLDFAGQALASLGYGATKKDGFSTAGGVAADVKTGLDLVSLGVKLFGGDVPSAVGTVSKGLGVVSGVAKGTPQGLTSAYKNASSLLRGGASSVVKNSAMDAAAAQGYASASKTLTGFSPAANTGINIGAGILSGLAASGDKYASIGNTVGSLFGPMGAIAGTVLGGIVSGIVDPGKNNYEGRVGADGSFTFDKIPGGRAYHTTYLFGAVKDRNANASAYYQAAIQKYLETGDKKAAAELLGDRGPTGYKAGNKDKLFGSLFSGPNNIGEQLDALRKQRGG